METFLARALAPFVLFAIALVVLYPVRRYLQRNMPDGWIKRLLLTKVGP